MRFVSTAFLILIAALPVQAQEVSATVPAEVSTRAPEGQIVLDIVVRGHIRVDPEVIRSRTRTKAGNPLNRKTLADDIRTLWRLGWFEDIQVEWETVPDGIRLIWAIRERPTVSEIAFQGNDDIDTDKLKEDLQFKANSVYSPTAVDRTLERIRRRYEQEGHFLASIRADTEPSAGQNTVKLTFHIEEGDKVLIRRIRFIGNKAFPESELRSQMLTKEQSMFRWFNDNGNYVREMLLRDSLVLKNFYLDNGYIDVKISDPVVELTSGRDALFVTFSVVEGKQYHVDSVRITGDLLETEALLLERLGTKPGETFSRARILDDQTVLERIYGDQSYAFANVTIIPRPLDVDSEKPRVALEINIDKGPSVSVRRVHISGNSRTRDNVIRREVRIPEGEKFSTTALERSQQKIRQLGFFDEVEFTKERVPGVPNQIDIRFTVTERSTGSLNVGGGYSSLDGLFVFSQIQQQNLFGRGQSLAFAGQLGKRSRSISIQYRDPRFYDSYWGYALTGDATQRKFFDFESLRVGGSLGVSYDFTSISPFFDGFSASIGFFGFRTKLSGLSPQLVALGDRVRNDTVKTGFDFTMLLNRLNDNIDPTVGSRHSASLRTAVNIFGVDSSVVSHFNLYEFSGTYFHPLFWNVIGVAKWQMSFLQRREPFYLLIEERFFGGGIENLRGYDPGSVSPFDVGQNGQAVRIGGNKQGFVSGEMVFPIYKPAKLKGVVFVDAGNVYSDHQMIFSGPWLADWGAGIRWFSPVGPIRLELGFPLVKPKYLTADGSGFGTPVFNFTIGQLF